MPQNFFDEATTSTGSEATDPVNYNLGIKLTPSVNGNFTGVKYYRATSDVYTPHTARIWSGGTLLKTEAFTDETSGPGWKSHTFATPLSVTAGTTYTVAVNAYGAYHFSGGYHASSIARDYLTAPANAGVYFAESSGGTTQATGEPTSTFNSATYFRDVIYEPTFPAGTAGGSSIILYPKMLQGTVNEQIMFAGVSNYLGTNGSAPYALTPNHHTRAGDLLIFYHYSRATGGNETVTIPTGFTSIANSLSANNGLIATGYRYFQAGDTTFTATITNHTSGTTGETVVEWIETYRATAASNPIGSVTASLSTWATSSTTAGPISPPADATLPAGAQVVVFGGRFDDAGTRATLTGDNLTWAARGSIAATSGNDAGGFVQTGLNESGTSQTITSKTFTLSSASTATGAGWMFTVLPYTAVGPTTAGQTLSVTPTFVVGSAIVPAIAASVTISVTPTLITGGTQAVVFGTTIQEENALTGNASSEWDVSGAGTTTLQGYAKEFSVSPGDAINFAISGTCTQVDIYRLGYYAGNGARKIVTISNTSTTQPAVASIASSNGAVRASSWTTTATWSVPSVPMSGVYIAVPINGGNKSHIPFVVRKLDAKSADITVKTSDATWTVYNKFAGVGASYDDGVDPYGDGVDGNFGTNSNRSHAASYDRPDTHRGYRPQTALFYAEYPLIRWLERNGFETSYISCYDLDQGRGYVNSKILISSGHDEYWSQGMWDNAVTHRGSGKHLIFMSGNEVFWRIRYADAGRTIWCYKDTMDGPGAHTGGTALDPVSWTGTWRDTRWGSRTPENLLTGTFFRMNGINYRDVVVNAATYGSSPFWRNTTVASGTNLTLTNAIGMEADETTGLAGKHVLLCTTTVNIDGYRADDNGQNYSGSGNMQWGIVLTKQTASSGVTAGFGTVTWAWKLDDTHEVANGGSGTVVSTQAKQATANLLRDMGAVAATLEGGLVAPTPVSAWSAYGLPVEANGQTLSVTPSFVVGSAFFGATASSQTLSVTPSFVVGLATANGRAVSQTLSVTPSFVVGSAFFGATASSQTLSVTPSFVAGLATANGRAVSQTLTVTPSFVVGSALIAGTANGQTLSVTTTLIAGAALFGSRVAGQTLSVTPSFVLGSAFFGATASSQTLSVAPSFVVGLATANGTAVSQTFSVTPSFVVGSALIAGTAAGQTLTVTPVFVLGVAIGTITAIGQLFSVIPVLIAGSSSGLVIPSENTALSVLFLLAPLSIEGSVDGDTLSLGQFLNEAIGNLRKIIYDSIDDDIPVNRIVADGQIYTPNMIESWASVMISLNEHEYWKIKSSHNLRVFGTYQVSIVSPVNRGTFESTQIAGKLIDSLAVYRRFSICGIPAIQTIDGPRFRTDGACLYTNVSGSFFFVLPNTLASV